VKELFEIIHEDGQFLVINKPAGLVCHPTKTDEYSSLIGRVRLYFGGHSHPQLINRLDRETSGLTLIAKDAEVARRIRQLWEARQVAKSYLAIVHGRVAREHHIIAAPLGKDELSPVAIKDCVRSDGSKSITEFWLKGIFARSLDSNDANEFESGRRGYNESGHAAQMFSLLQVLPQTGRKHQIRIHLAYIGHPVVGDKLYGGDDDIYLALVENRLTDMQRSKLILPHHALHAAELRFNWEGIERVFRAEPESWFKAFCSTAHVPA
jgi:23S rRNA pseudouridine1911/1915/1917 synthase